LATCRQVPKRGHVRALHIPQRRQARHICRIKIKTLTRPAASRTSAWHLSHPMGEGHQRRRGGIFRSLRTATMMSLLTELGALVAGDATNMPALTGLEKSVFHPCFICG